jgi:hypothetical protein
MSGPRQLQDGSRTKASRSAEIAYATAADDERRIREGLAQSEAGDAVELTPEELDEYAETGALPERVERWLSSRG